MIRRHMIMGAAAVGLAVASCSGSNNNSPTPTPTPTGTPTPTPSASPTYDAFPLSKALEFSTISAATSYTGDDTAGAVTLGAANTDAGSSRVRLATDPVITTGTYVVRENVEESRFTNTNILTAPTPAVEEFAFRTTDTATAGKFSQVNFLNNAIPSQVTSNTALQLSSVSYFNWWRGDSTTGTKRITTGLWGFPTVYSDLPTSTSQAYTSVIRGRMVSVANGATTIVPVTGTATVQVNFATGVVTLSASLSTAPASGTGTAIGTFAAQGAIPVGATQYIGSFNAGSPLSGTIVGSFFGSAGKEVGMTFALSGNNNGADQRIVGVVVGKKATAL